MLPIKPLLALVACWLLQACVESNPQPWPGQDGNSGNPLEDDSAEGQTKGSVETDRFALSAPSEDDLVIAVGGAGTADGSTAGTAKVIGSTEEPVEFPVLSDGSFGLIIVASAGDTVVFDFASQESDQIATISMEVPERIDTDRTSPWLLDAESGFSEPTAGGPGSEEPSDWYNGGGDEPRIDVQANSDDTATLTASALVVTPLALVSLYSDSGASLMLQADATGAFVAVIDAKPGEQVALFATNPAAPDKATSPLFVTIPEMDN